MPVIIFIGTAARFTPETEAYFKEKYECCTLKDAYAETRSALINQNPNILYLVPNLGKPERYEIFCLSRKNSQIFISLIDELNDSSVPSDKNPISMKIFDGSELENKFLKSKTKETVANKRSKSISFSSLNDLKSSFKKIREEKYGNFTTRCELVFQTCEERIIKSWISNPEISLKEVEECYKSLVDYELKAKGLLN